MIDPTSHRGPDLAAWPGATLGVRLPGGARNPVYLAEREAERFVVRVSGRASESLAWELQLLDAVQEAGVRVPQTVPTADGRRHDGGVLLQRFIPGQPPRTGEDWERVVRTLMVVHEVTRDWPQRPGFASAAELMHRCRGGDVDLGVMPAPAVALVRASWLPVLDGPECAVHGDLGAGNVLVTEDDVALIDWDEARVDVPAFDFAHFPTDVAIPGPWDRDTLGSAGIAWETATCWVPEPDYAARRLQELQARPR